MNFIFRFSQDDFGHADEKQQVRDERKENRAPEDDDGWSTVLRR